MAGPRSRVALVSTEDRKSGVRQSIQTLKINPVKNRDVLIKPNFNTADLVPGSTHNDTLVSLVEEMWDMGARSVSLGERSYPPTRDVMTPKGHPAPDAEAPGEGHQFRRPGGEGLGPCEPR